MASRALRENKSAEFVVIAAAGRRRVGPNTVAKLARDILFCSSNLLTLKFKEFQFYMNIVHKLNIYSMIIHSVGNNAKILTGQTRSELSFWVIFGSF